MTIVRSATARRIWLAQRWLMRTTRGWLSRAFDVPRETRVAIVEKMLEGHAGSAPTYWLQLCLAFALATFGLVLNGAAVVIGAMLVSPLMTPIVELGMGLAAGSPLLSIRSLVRTSWSIAVVVTGAALITAVLPFHEVTAEISSRTSPTALDLLIAVFCALAAAFTTLRSASQNVSAAAGTAVAIALLPPLCVVGFGLGTGQHDIAGGAFLLFTANMCAILLFAVLTFLLFGFNLVDTQHLEDERFGSQQPTGRLVRLVRGMFGSRYGTWMRLIIPALLVAIVWLPLKRALREVTWEVRARTQIKQIIDALPLAQAAVRSSVAVGHGTIHVRMVVVAKPKEARELQLTMATEIADATATTPAVEVVAVPDLDMLEEAAMRLAKPSVIEPPRRPDLPAAASEIAERLRGAWPRGAGQLRRWRLDLNDPEHPMIEISHLGPPLGTAAEGLLSALLAERLGTALGVLDLALPSEATAADRDDGEAWLPALATALDAVRADAGLMACVSLPADPLATPAEDQPGQAGKNGKIGYRDSKGHKGHKARKRSAAQHLRDLDLARVRKTALASLAEGPADRVHVDEGPQWLVQIRSESCVADAAAAVPPTAAPAPAVTEPAGESSPSVPAEAAAPAAATETRTGPGPAPGP